MAQTGLKKFLEYVQLGTSDKVARLLDKGLDPNYHDSDSGGREGTGGFGNPGEPRARGLPVTGFSCPLRDPPDAGCPDGRLRGGDSNPVPGWGPHRLPGPGWHDGTAQGCLRPSLPGSHGEGPHSPRDPFPETRAQKHPQIAVFPIQTALGELPQTLPAPPLHCRSFH